MVIIDEGSDSTARKAAKSRLTFALIRTLKTALHAYRLDKEFIQT